MVYNSNYVFVFFYPYLNKYSESRIFLFLAFVITFIIRLANDSYTSFLPLFFLAEFYAGRAFADNKKIEVLILSLIMIFVNPLMTLPFFFFFLMMIPKWEGIPTKPLVFLSNSTLILFLFHESIMKVILGRWKIYLLNNISAVIVLILTVFGCVFLSKIIQNKIIEKI